MTLDAVKNSMQAFAHLPAETPELELRERALAALRELHRECVRVRESANDYPANPITADVWLDGALLGPLAEGLAGLLRQRGLTDLEEQAHTLRCMAILAVQSHYHHLVGPAMLARAECNERLGKNELAVGIYQAVRADFSWLVDEWSGTEEAPGADDRCSLECLAQAVAGLLRHRPAGGDLRELETLREDCERLLARGNDAG